MLTIKNPKTFDWANMALSDCCEGNAADSYFTLKLFNLIEEKLTELGMSRLLCKLIMPSLSTFSEMEYEGMRVSEEKLESVGRQLRVANIEEEDNLYSFEEVQTSDNLSSNNDLIEVLYTREGAFEMYPPDRTAKGTPSVSAPTLKLLLEHIEEELKRRG
jgi:DNA polymerase I-like protein with 3'-5' exonuclease and polymerase domains|tara:strand:- start:793 stop:1272 length:480 start_codon:yes stop_codon:yes gene_type:complete